MLSYPELKRIVDYPEGNRSWHRALDEVAGVYLIVDGTGTGLQYVGSAPGQGGIMARWAEYVCTGHGGNKMLHKLLEVDLKAVERFQFTVLRTLTKTLTRAEVVEFKQLYKSKLGSRAFGLNLN